MPKVVRGRQSRTSSRAGSDAMLDNATAISASSRQSRAALGDVSNRRSTRLTKKSNDEAVEKNTARTSRARASRQRLGNDSTAAPETKRNAKTTTESEDRHKSLRSSESDEEKAKRGKSVGASSRARSSSRSKRSNAGSSEVSSDTGERVAKRSYENIVAAAPKAKKSRKSNKKATKDAPKEKASTGSRVRHGKLRATDKQGSSKNNLKTKTVPSTRRGRPQPRSLCCDFLASTDYKLERKPFDASKYTAGISSHDTENRDNVLEVSNYVTDIFQRLFHAETTTRPEEYMDGQKDINSRMRAILVDWLVEVHMKFRLVPETLYLCINIIDRYCSIVPVQRSKLQLVGVTALLVACKYEEIYPPEVRDCVYITDRAYNRQEVLDMEQDIVQKLEFKMTVPTAYPFLQRFLLITKAPEVARAASNYYLERCLQEHDMLQFRPSLIAVAVVSLALNNPEIRDKDGLPEDRPGVPKALVEYTGFKVSDILECAELVANKVGEEVTTASRRQLVAVKRKYESRKYHQVSTEVLEPDIDDIIS